MHHTNPPAARMPATSPSRRRLAALAATLLIGSALLAALPQPASAQTPAAHQVSASYQHISGLIAQRQYAQAVEAADQYLAGNGRDPQVRFLKGVAQDGLGDTPGAIATFTELTQVYPELPEPYNNLAAIHARQGDYEKARDALLLAVQANPAYAAARENLGDVYIQLAQQQYRQAQALEPGNARLPLKLQAAEQLLGQP